MGYTLIVTWQYAETPDDRESFYWFSTEEEAKEASGRIRMALGEQVQFACIRPAKDGEKETYDESQRSFNQYMQEFAKEKEAVR